MNQSPSFSEWWIVDIRRGPPLPNFLECQGAETLNSCEWFDIQTRPVWQYWSFYLVCMSFQTEEYFTVSSTVATFLENLFNLPCRNMAYQWTCRTWWLHTTQECIPYTNRCTMPGQKSDTSGWLPRRSIHTWSLLGSDEDLSTKESR